VSLEEERRVRADAPRHGCAEASERSDEGGTHETTFPSYQQDGGQLQLPKEAGGS